MLHAHVVVDLGFGDAGKGTLVDYLVRDLGADLVVRFNGGPQAAHNVVTDNGQHHTFSTFCSGALAGADSYLGPRVLVNPYVAGNEAASLERRFGIRALDTLIIDPDCPLITPFHAAGNRLRELGRLNKHGSCGHGIGECQRMVNEGHGLSADQLYDIQRRGLINIRDWMLESLVADGTWARVKNLGSAQKDIAVFDDPLYTTWMRFYRDFADRVRIERPKLDGDVIFEGAQGVLIDQKYGFQPYTTWSDCTFNNAWRIALDQRTEMRFTKYGVVRAYETRHGAGPFPSESPEVAFREPHNSDSRWQGNWRQGWTDLIMRRYARDIVGDLDVLAITHVDTVARRNEWKIVDRYRTAGQRIAAIKPTPSKDHDTAYTHQEKLASLLELVDCVETRPVSAIDALRAIADVYDAPEVIHSHGPRASDKIRFSRSAAAAVAV